MQVYNGDSLTHVAPFLQGALTQTSESSENNTDDYIYYFISQ